MRVIAGIARRIALAAPKGGHTRPTADRAKEGLFNILAPKISGAKFLDIFCGSGAIGIEALSRGAQEAVFIDNAADAIYTLRENLAKTKLTHLSEIFETNAETALARLAAQGRVFNLIFLDPPYGSGLLEETLARVRELGLLSNDGTVIAETDSVTTDSQIDVLGLSCTDHRIYGRTRFLFFSGTDFKRMFI